MTKTDFTGCVEKEPISFVSGSKRLNKKFAAGVRQECDVTTAFNTYVNNPTRELNPS